MESPLKTQTPALLHRQWKYNRAGSVVAQKLCFLEDLPNDDDIDLVSNSKSFKGPSTIATNIAATTLIATTTIVRMKTLTFMMKIVVSPW